MIPLSLPNGQWLSPNLMTHLINDSFKHWQTLLIRSLLESQLTNKEIKIKTMHG